MLYKNVNLVRNEGMITTFWVCCFIKTNEMIISGSTEGSKTTIKINWYENPAIFQEVVFTQTPKNITLRLRYPSFMNRIHHFQVFNSETLSTVIWLYICLSIIIDHYLNPCFKTCRVYFEFNSIWFSLHIMEIQLFRFGNTFKKRDEKTNPYFLYIRNGHMLIRSPVFAKILFIRYTRYVLRSVSDRAYFESDHFVFRVSD